MTELEFHTVVQNNYKQKWPLIEIFDLMNYSFSDLINDWSLSYDDDTKDLFRFVIQLKASDLFWNEISFYYDRIELKF